MKRLNRVRNNPKPKFSFRRNITPPLVGIILMMGIFWFQNPQYIEAKYFKEKIYQVSKIAENIEVKDEIIAKDASRLMIPSLDLQADIISESSTIESVVEQRLQKGVVRYGNLAEFGNYGNVVILGHSSGNIWVPGDFKYIFTYLDKLVIGDQVFVDYMGQRYIYRVISKEIIEPTNLKVLEQPADKKFISLITCTPVGTNFQRLVVQGEQISNNKAKDADVKENISKIEIKNSNLVKVVDPYLSFIKNSLEI